MSSRMEVPRGGWLSPQLPLCPAPIAKFIPAARQRVAEPQRLPEAAFEVCVRCPKALKPKAQGQRSLWPWEPQGGHSQATPSP